MPTNPRPSRRVFARFVCRLPAKVFLVPGKQLEAEALNIGMGGALLRVKGTLPPAPCSVELVLGRETLTVDARMIHCAGRDPKDSRYMYYGMGFRLNERTEAQLRQIVDRLHGREEYGPRLSRDYWEL